MSSNDATLNTGTNGPAVEQLTFTAEENNAYLDYTALAIKAHLTGATVPSPPDDRWQLWNAMRGMLYDPNGLNADMQAAIAARTAAAAALNASDDTTIDWVSEQGAFLPPALNATLPSNPTPPEAAAGDHIRENGAAMIGRLADEYVIGLEANLKSALKKTIKQQFGSDASTGGVANTTTVPNASAPPQPLPTLNGATASTAPPYPYPYAHPQYPYPPPAWGWGSPPPPQYAMGPPTLGWGAGPNRSNPAEMKK